MPHYVVLSSGTVARECDAPEGFEPQEIFGGSDADYLLADPTVGVGWTTADGGRTWVAPVAPPVDLRAYAAAARYAREAGGITIGGMKVATDEASQARIGNAYVLLQASGAATIDFKGSDGAFATLSADQFKSLALAVGAHGQGCFAAEAQVVSDVVAGKVTTQAQVDAAFAAVTA